MAFLMLPVYIVLFIALINVVGGIQDDARKNMTKKNEYWRCEARDEWRINKH